MMEQHKIKVSVTKYGKPIKELEESYEGSLSSLITALKNIKNSTNNYLTEQVETEKNLNNNPKKKSKTKAALEKTLKDDNEASDVEIEEDFIDSQIKHELSIKHRPHSDKTNKSEKRSKSQVNSIKRLKQ